MRIRNKFSMAVVLACAMFAVASTTLARERSRPLKVLAIGNSFSYSLMAQLPACAKALPGAELDFATLVIGGCSLKRHWENVTKADDPEFRPYDVCWSFTSAPDRNKPPFGNVMKGGKSNIPQMLRAVKWDIVTIQQVSSESWYYKSYQPYADNIIAKIRELAPQAEIRVHQTWAYCNACERICGDAIEAYRKALPVTFKPPTKEQQAAFKDGELPDMGGEPVGSYRWGKGPAWNKDAKDNDVRKLRCDAIHLNREGQYLQACTWLAALFDDDLSRLAYKPDFLSEEKAALMRKCAVDAVKARRSSCHAAPCSQKK